MAQSTLKLTCRDQSVRIIFLWILVIAMVSGFIVMERDVARRSVLLGRRALTVLMLLDLLGLIELALNLRAS
jgi:hypothetical protein